MSDIDPTVRPDPLPEDFDRALRPQELDEFVGQAEARALPSEPAEVTQPTHRAVQVQLRAMALTERRAKVMEETTKGKAAMIMKVKVPAMVPA